MNYYNYITIFLYTAALTGHSSSIPLPKIDPTDKNSLDEKLDSYLPIPSDKLKLIPKRKEAYLPISVADHRSSYLPIQEFQSGYYPAEYQNRQYYLLPQSEYASYPNHHQHMGYLVAPVENQQYVDQPTHEKINEVKSKNGETMHTSPSVFMPSFTYRRTTGERRRVYSSPGISYNYYPSVTSRRRIPAFSGYQNEDDYFPTVV